MQKADMTSLVGFGYLTSTTTLQRPEPMQLSESPRRVLLVDDDPVYLEVLSRNLEHESFEVVAFSDSVAAISWLLTGGSCDVILLDWYMPDLSGKVFLNRLRDAGLLHPVIVLTGAESADVEDMALECGAVDFVEKSRRFSVLVKRLGIIIDGSNRDEGGELRDGISLGPLRLDARSCRAHWCGNEVALTLTEFRIVYKLAAQPGVDFTYREIYDVVHGRGFCAGDGADGIRVNVRSLIKRIRRKFREIDGRFAAIENYPAHGYRWVPDTGHRNDAGDHEDTWDSSEEPAIAHSAQA